MSKTVSLLALCGPAAAGALLLAANPAAAAVRYEFQAFSTYYYGPMTASFSYVAPDFVTANTVIPTPAGCLVTRPPGLACGATQFFVPDASQITDANADALGFGVADLYHFFYFPDGALGAYGSYASFVLDDQTGRLTVSQVPEPAIWGLLLLGMATIGHALRRRRRPGRLRENASVGEFVDETRARARFNWERSG